MPSIRTRRLGLALAVLLLAVAGGVLGAELVERRALDAEERHVADRLANASCLSDWGTNEGGGPRARAGVIGLSGDGLLVRVTLPYAYSTDVENTTVHADAGSRAVYAVAPTGTRRIRGDEIAPC